MPTITPGARPLEFIRTLDTVDGVQRREVWTFDLVGLSGVHLSCWRIEFRLKRLNKWRLIQQLISEKILWKIPIPPDIRAALADALVLMAREAVEKMPNPVQEKRVIALARRYGFKESSNG